MVPLIRRSPNVVQGRELEAPLAAYRLAAAALPDREASLLDRLFALECLARAGREARQEREHLLPALRTAESFVDDEWEPDVPHAAVLGQAIAAMDALDQQPPRAWVDLLVTTTEELLGRQGRFGLTSDPRLLASVTRGLSSSGAELPQPLLRACGSYLDQGTTTDGAAELADALLRHHRGGELATRAADAAFSSRHVDDNGAAVARWWLAERWSKQTGEKLPVAADAINVARTQALIGTPPVDPRAAAMLAEVAARSIGDLVLLPATALDELSSSRSVRAIREARVWRGLVAGTLAVVLFVQLASVLTWLGMHPSDTTIKAVGAVVAFVGAFLVAHFITSAYKAGGRAVSPTVERFVDGFLPFLVAVVSLFAH